VSGPHAQDWDWPEWEQGSDPPINPANLPELKRLVALCLAELAFPQVVVAPLAKLVVPPPSPEVHRNLVTLSLPPRVVHNLRYAERDKKNLYVLVEAERLRARALGSGVVLP
jgi:hypothetical protein